MGPCEITLLCVCLGITFPQLLEARIVEPEEIRRLVLPRSSINIILQFAVRAIKLYLLVKCSNCTYTLLIFFMRLMPSCMAHLTIIYLIALM
jgi:hypothetical protein